MLQERSGSKVPLKIRYRVGNKFIYAGDALQLTEVMIHEVKVTSAGNVSEEHLKQLAEARSKFRRPHPLNVSRILGQT